MVPERPNTEDILINKSLGKRLTREDEFIFDFELQERTRAVKRRFLDKWTPGLAESEDALLEFTNNKASAIEKP